MIYSSKISSVEKKSHSNQSHTNFHDNPDGQNLYTKFKIFMKQYGFIGVGVYWTIWTATFASFYMSFKSGLIDYNTWTFLHLDKLEHIYIKYANMIGIDTDIHPINHKTETLLVAFMAAKVTKPIQWCLVYGLTPHIAYTLGYSPNKPKLTEKLENIHIHVKSKNK